MDGWIAGGSSAFALGLNMIYYTDFDNGSLVFRPEIGFGLDKFKLVYGYNANLTKNRLDRINKNLVGLTYCFKLKQLKDKIRQRKEHQKIKSALFWSDEKRTANIGIAASGAGR